MLNVRFFAFVVLLSLIAPCKASSLPGMSLQNLLTDRDCESVPELLGEWTAQGEDLHGNWAIQRIKDQKYRLVGKDADAETGHAPGFDICVAHLGGRLFFDAIFRPMKPDGQPALNEDDTTFWVPIHLFGRLEIKDDRLDFQLLDGSWLQDHLKSGALQIAHTEYEGDILLVAPTEELKKSVTHFASDPEAFAWTERFSRVQVSDDKANHK